jgi:hypothetical protein
LAALGRHTVHDANNLIASAAGCVVAADMVCAAKNAASSSTRALGESGM